MYVKSDAHAPLLSTNREVFLVADADSINSFLNPKIVGKSTPGDFGGHILAVDIGHDPDDPDHRNEESPGYNGEVSVLASLLYGDVYAIIKAQNQWLEDLWPLASEHPLQVYVGPTVKAERALWKKGKQGA